MPTQPTYIEELLRKWYRNLTSDAETAELFQYLRDSNLSSAVTPLIEAEWKSVQPVDLFTEAERATRKEQVLLRIRQTEETMDSIPVVHRIHFLKTAWFRYAAVLLLIAGTATFLYLNNQPQKDIVQKQSTSINTPVIKPGGNKAILTLADGSTIVLDSVPNGALTTQGTTHISKPDAGSIIYNAGVKSGELLYNTISTPKGGQYQIVLSDGTKVWLNASSSITFPTVLTGEERVVDVTGEVYMEIISNHKQPFIVRAKGTQLQVLGTSFNLNAYPDEANIKTTLLEGSLKVISAGRVAILQPGQQATSGETISVKSNVDIGQALAWKNGLFNFNGSDLRSVMRQLERWYDVKVQYEGTVSNDLFKGKMYRNVNLSDVLDMLREMDVNFRLQGKTVIVIN